jgi:hypothetical protein
MTTTIKVFTILFALLVVKSAHAFGTHQHPGSCSSESGMQRVFDRYTPSTATAICDQTDKTTTHLYVDSCRP